MQSRAALEKLHAMMLATPGARGLIVRKTLVSPWGRPPPHRRPRWTPYITAFADVGKCRSCSQMG